jgi:hypothetical protein
VRADSRATHVLKPAPFVVVTKILRRLSFLWVLPRSASWTKTGRRSRRASPTPLIHLTSFGSEWLPAARLLIDSGFLSEKVVRALLESNDARSGSSTLIACLFFDTNIECVSALSDRVIWAQGCSLESANYFHGYARGQACNWRATWRNGRRRSRTGATFRWMLPSQGFTNLRESSA